MGHGTAHVTWARSTGRQGITQGSLSMELRSPSYDGIGVLGLETAGDMALPIMWAGMGDGPRPTPAHTEHAACMRSAQHVGWLATGQVAGMLQSSLLQAAARCPKQHSRRNGFSAMRQLKRQRDAPNRFGPSSKSLLTQLLKRLDNTINAAGHLLVDDIQPCQQRGRVRCVHGGFGRTIWRPREHAQAHKAT